MEIGDVIKTIPEYFYYAMAGELFAIKGCKDGMAMFSQPDDEWIGYDSGTNEWYEALRQTCHKLDMDWLIDYYDELEPYDADLLNGDIEDGIYKHFEKADASVYYDYLVDKVDANANGPQEWEPKEWEPREPLVPNKYNLDVNMVRHLRVLDKEAIHKKPFHDNSNYPGMGQLTGGLYKDGFEDAFYSIIVDADGVKDFTVYVWEMCTYNFKHFYDFEEIECEVDLEIQELILKRLNQLIDDGVLGLPEGVS